MVTNGDPLPDIEEIFSKAIALPIAHRDSFVRSACDGDQAAETEVHLLLTSHARNQSDSFVLNRPLSVDPQRAVPPMEQVGSVLGRYKLLEEIGEGGMGVVYMAEQVEDVRRRVAIKVIKLGMDTRQVIARFEAERQAMALFDHPNITKVLDAGVTASGRPYFVMELVRGAEITEFVQSNQLRLEERLDLFGQVCHAVQHAHQKGIIHRDIKPSNILVSMMDGQPIAKVIDFGIAKAVGQQRLTEKTLFTRYAALIGTPHYMSPEQAELNGADVDTRSDIYSLGVLLYELLTGTTPISKETLKEISPTELFETIRDTAIEAPSDRLVRIRGESGDMATKTKFGSGLRSNAWRRDVELDWVVMKALDCDRKRRYSSANEFADDVARFLRDEPVLAAPPSRFRKVWSHVYRYRRVLVTVFAFAVLLIVASVACLAFALRAKTANSQLLDTNAELQTRVDQLKVAQAKITEQAAALEYDTAISVALTKFEMDFDAEVETIAMQIFPHYFGIDQAAESGAVAEFDLCLMYDSRLLLDFDEPASVQPYLSRIRDVINSDDEFCSRVFGDELAESDTMDEADLEHSPECLRLEAAANAAIPEHRHVFYRYLVTEYRKTFGEDDPRVAEALQMFAMSLIEVGETDEAEARLREAVVIGDEAGKNGARGLLATLQKRASVDRVER